MSIGTDLRRARESAKLSAEQIAERIKVSIQKIEALEGDDLQLLPHGIYLEGIVRAYAREVAMDPEPLVQQIRQEAGELDHGDVSALEAFPQERTVQTEGASLVPSNIEIHNSDDPREAQPPFLVPTPEDVTIVPVRPAYEPRAGSFTAVGLWVVLFAAVVWGGYRFGREATQRLEADKPDVTAKTSSPTPDAAISQVPEPSSSTELGPRKPPLDTVLPVPTAPVRRLPEGAGRAPESAASPGPLENVSGSWALVTHVESSSVSRFADLHLGYRIQLEQRGGRIKGAGKKISEGGDAIRPRAQTPIVVAGTIDGGRLTLTFNERGARRPTEGKFILLLDDDGTLRGRFSSTAARSSGSVEAHRLVQ